MNIYRFKFLFNYTIFLTKKQEVDVICENFIPKTKQDRHYHYWCSLSCLVDFVPLKVEHLYSAEKPFCIQQKNLN